MFKALTAWFRKVTGRTYYVNFRGKGDRATKIFGSFGPMSQDTAFYVSGRCNNARDGALYWVTNGPVYPDNVTS